jgi:cell division septum initiation protein DivIVA
VKGEVEELRATSNAEAESLLVVARHEAEELRSQADAETKTLVSQARARSEEMLGRAKDDASDRVAAAQHQSDEILDRARLKAEEIVREARGEKLTLQRRISQLRSAVGDIEREVQRLASTAAARAGIIGGMIEFEHRQLEEEAAASGTAGATVGTATRTERITVTLPPDDPEGPNSAGEGPSSQAIEPESAVAGTMAIGPGDVVPMSGASAITLPEAAAIEDDIALAGDAFTTGDPASWATAPDEAHEAPAVGGGTPADPVTEMAAGRDRAFADPDGSGRPPAERATVLPPTLASEEPDEQEARSPYRTVYQRTGKTLRRRLRDQGQDPSQRGR